MANAPSPLAALLAYHNTSGEGGNIGYQKVASASKGDASGGTAYEGGGEGGGSGQTFLNAGGIPDDAQSVAAFEAVKKYDPNARWEKVQGNSGGGDQGSNASADGYRLVYDQTLLPQVKGRGMEYVGGVTKDSKLINPNAVYHDEYGDYTENTNRIKEKDPAWVTYAPLAIAAIASMGTALPALAATGAITSAAAGGVTGAMAAASAAEIAAASGGLLTAAGTGAAGAGSAGTSAGMWGNDLLAQIATKAPNIARSVNEGNFGIEQLLTTVAGASGLPYAKLIGPALALGKMGMSAMQGSPAKTGGATSTMNPTLLALLTAAAGAKRGR